MNHLITITAALSLAVTAHTQSNGTDMFDDSYVHRIDVTLPQNNFWDSLSYYYDQSWMTGTDVKYMMGQVTIDGVVIDSIGFKQKGFYSNWGAQGSVKKPFKLSFNTYTDQKYDGLTKINLSNGFEDPAMMRDALAYKFMRDAGIKAPRTSYAELYLNNTYWGLYVVVEEINKRALKNWFDDNDGNLYKCSNNTSLAWQGNNPEAYKDEFELQTNETADDWSGFIRFVDGIHHSGSHFRDSMIALLNTDYYLYVLAADVIMYNWDSYYDHGRNFFLYHNPTDNRMQWIPWDYNLSFSTNPTDLIVDYMFGEPKELVRKMQLPEHFRSDYFDHVCILMDNYFNLDHLEGFIDATAAMIRPSLNADPNKFFTISAFDESLEHDIVVQGQWGMELHYKGLKQFITERQTQVAGQLAGYNHDCTGLSVGEQGIAGLEIYPNPFGETFGVAAGQKMDRIEVYSMSGQLLYAENPMGTEVTITLPAINAGIYIVRIHAGGFTDRKSVV